MIYKLRKFRAPAPAMGIDVVVNGGSKEVDRQEMGEILFGTFYMEDKKLEFAQMEEYLFDLEDVKLIAHIATEIEISGFENIYNEAE